MYFRFANFFKGAINLKHQFKINNITFKFQSINLNFQFLYYNLIIIKARQFFFHFKVKKPQKPYLKSKFPAYYIYFSIIRPIHFLIHCNHQNLLNLNYLFNIQIKLCG